MAECTTKKSIKKVSTVKKATTKRSSKKQTGTQDLFSLYIENIKKARIASQEIIAPYAQEEKSTLVINLIWEAIFEYFCTIDKEDINPSSLNTLAGVVQKLLATSKETKDRGTNSSISPQALAEIEDKLNLL